MIRKLKLALVALLGFSAACSTVKNTPRKAKPAEPAEPGRRGEADSCRISGEVVDTASVRPAIRVMYGVRMPESVRQNRQPEAE